MLASTPTTALFYNEHQQSIRACFELCFGGKEFRAQHNFINILQKSYRTTLQALGLHANANVTQTICCSDSRADGL